MKCPKCGCLFLNIIDADRIYSNWKEIGKITWYRCVQCNNVFGYYIINYDKGEVKVIEISLNNS